MPYRPSNCCADPEQWQELVIVMCMARARNGENRQAHERKQPRIKSESKALRNLTPHRVGLGERHRGKTAVIEPSRS
jgi:hypothetical protein